MEEITIGQNLSKDIEVQKKIFVQLLKDTERDGVDQVVEGLEKLGFFTAPASSKFHCNYKGGLLEHSLNVYYQAFHIRAVELRIRPELENALPIQSVAIAALLHDVCKAEIYKPEKKNKKNMETGKWEVVDGWSIDNSHCPLGHGEKSVIRLLQMGLKMTSDEILAIRWHMGNWELADTLDAKNNFSAAVDKCPLLSILIAADELASRITEMPFRNSEIGA